VSADEEEQLWALMVWMLGGTACAAFAFAVPGDVVWLCWVLAGVSAIVVAARVAFLLFNVHARASLKAPSSKPAAAAPSAAQSLRAAGVEDEWVREYVEKPLGVDAQSLISVPNPDGSKTYYAREQRRDGGWSVHRVESPCSDSVEHPRRRPTPAQSARASAELERSKRSQTVIYRPPRMHLQPRTLRYNPPRRKEPEDDPWYRRKDPE